MYIGLTTECSCFSVVRISSGWKCLFNSWTRFRLLISLWFKFLKSSSSSCELVSVISSVLFYNKLRSILNSVHFCFIDKILPSSTVYCRFTVRVTETAGKWALEFRKGQNLRQLVTGALWSTVDVRFKLRLSAFIRSLLEKKEWYCKNFRKLCNYCCGTYFLSKKCLWFGELYELCIAVERSYGLALLCFELILWKRKRKSQFTKSGRDSL